MCLGRHWSELETPALCLDLNQFDARLQSVADGWKESHQNWWATGSELEVPAFARRVTSHGAFGLSHENLHQAIVASRQVSTSFRLSQISIHADQLRQLGELPECLLPCDHYAQAEQYSNWGIRSGHRFPVLIEVNLGLDQTGVRPGSDARHLAQGLKTLPGIRVVGVTGSLGIIPSSPDLRWLNSRVRLLTDLLSEIGQSERDSLRVHMIAGGGGVEQLRDWDDVTDVSTPSLLSAGWPNQTESPLKLIGSVISRSRLERAVLDVGRFHLGGSSSAIRIPATTIGRPLPDIQSIEIGATATALTLGPESFDLIIGEKVEVVLPDPELTWKLHSTIYGVRDGVIEEVWQRPFQWAD